jgi:hypothetical protein
MESVITVAVSNVTQLELVVRKLVGWEGGHKVMLLQWCRTGLRSKRLAAMLAMLEVKNPRFSFIYFLIFVLCDSLSEARSMLLAVKQGIRILF